MVPAADLTKRIQLDRLYPPFRAKVLQLLAATQAHGAIYAATSGLRTYEEQDGLYARGRSSPPLGRGHVVTMARGGYSPHNFGVAIDATRHKGAWAGRLVPDYADAAYGELAEEAQKLGLEPGLHWPNLPDAPHVQLPLKAKGITWAQMRLWYRAGGYKSLFAELDHRGPW